jgi:hypothetical protein
MTEAERKRQSGGEMVCHPYSIPLFQYSLLHYQGIRHSIEPVEYPWALQTQSISKSLRARLVGAEVFPVLGRRSVGACIVVRTDKNQFCLVYAVPFSAGKPRSKATLWKPLYQDLPPSLIHLIRGTIFL